MNEIAEAFWVGGTWMLVVAGIACIGALWTVGYTFMSARGRRWSALAWWVGPIAATAVAALGIGWQISAALSAIEGASSELRAEMIMKATDTVTYIAAGVGIANAALGALVSVGAGIANVAADPNEGARNRGLPAAVLLVSLASGAGVILWATEVYAAHISKSGLTLWAFVAPALVVGGIGCALAAVPEVDEETPDELVSRRLTAGFATLSSVAFGLVASWAIGYQGVIEAFAVAGPENKREFYTEGLALLNDGVATTGGIALGVAGIVMTALVASAVGGHFEGSVRRNAVHCTMAAVVPLVACIYASTQMAALSTALHEEVIYADWTASAVRPAPAHESARRLEPADSDASPYLRSGARRAIDRRYAYLE